MRLGWLYGPAAVVDVLRRLSITFPVKIGFTPTFLDAGMAAFLIESLTSGAARQVDVGTVTTADGATEGHGWRATSTASAGAPGCASRWAATLGPAFTATTATSS